MADDTILNPGSGGDTIATDDVGGVKYPRSKITVGADGSADGDVSSSLGLPVEIHRLVSPKSVAGSQAALAVGASADLDGTQVGSGLTGYLLRAIASSSVAFKAELKAVLNGVETVLDTRISQPGWVVFEPPDKRLWTVAEDVTAGLDVFRVTITNLGTGTTAADVYGTLQWDEA